MSGGTGNAYAYDTKSLGLLALSDVIESSAIIRCQKKTVSPHQMPFVTEADTCRRYVLPKLYAAGWTDDQISEQKSFTDGRIVIARVAHPFAPLLFAKGWGVNALSLTRAGSLLFLS